MPDSFPRLIADDRGVWREDEPGHPFGIEWREIVGVGGYRLDAITRAYTVVELVLPSGHWIELHADWPGFTQVIEAISVRLPGIRASWFEDINALELRASPICVWRGQ